MWEETHRRCIQSWYPDRDCSARSARMITRQEFCPLPRERGKVKRRNLGQDASLELITYADRYRLLCVEDSLSIGVHNITVRSTKSDRTSLQRGKERNTNFQWVYLACGPVLNLTGLCVAAKEISNHARKACASGIGEIGAWLLRLGESECARFDHHAQSFRVARSSKGALKVRSSFLAVSRSMCYVVHAPDVRKPPASPLIIELKGYVTLMRYGSVTTDFKSTVSTNGSRRAISLIQLKSNPYTFSQTS